MPLETRYFCSSAGPCEGGKRRRRRPGGDARCRDRRENEGGEWREERTWRIAAKRVTRAIEENLLTKNAAIPDVVWTTMSSFYEIKAPASCLTAVSDDEHSFIVSTRNLKSLNEVRFLRRVLLPCNNHLPPIAFNLCNRTAQASALQRGGRVAFVRCLVRPQTRGLVSSCVSDCSLARRDSVQ